MAGLREKDKDKVNSYKNKQYKKHAVQVQQKRKEKRKTNPGYDKEWKKKEYAKNKLDYARRNQKHIHWKEVIAKIETLPPKKKKWWMDRVEEAIDLNILLLDLKRSKKEATKNGEKKRGNLC